MMKKTETEAGSTGRSSAKVLRRLTGVAVVALMLCAVLVMPSAAWEADTSWYEENQWADEYTIYTADELVGLANLVNSGESFEGKIVSLGSDIDLSGYQNWIPIGISYYSPFCGTFNGQGHTISNLTILESSDNTYAGLFGYAYGSNISNCNFEDCNIAVTNINVGCVIGHADYSNISNCIIIDSTITSTCNSIGGVIGYFTYGNIKNCYVDRCTINGKGIVGGVIGDVVGEGTIIASSAFNSIINGTTSYIGSVAGSVSNGDRINIDQCSALNCTVTGSSYVGGITGGMVNVHFKNCFVENCVITGTENVGSLIGGGGSECYVSNCSATSCTVNGTNFVGGISGTGDFIDDCLVTECKINGTSCVSGIAGFGGTIRNCSVQNCIINGTSSIGSILGSQIEYSGYGEEWFVNNCSVNDSTITGSFDIGGIVGSGRIIRNCSVQNCTIGGNGSDSGIGAVGGIGGYVNTDGNITDCTVSACTIYGTSEVGGISGSVPCRISGCSVNDSTITGTDHYVGGISGCVWGTGILNACSVTNCSVNGASFGVGGVSGDVQSNGYVTNCSAVNVIVCGSNNLVGGIVGSVDSNNINNCSVFDAVVKGVNQVGGITGHGGIILNSVVIDSTVTSEENYVGGISGRIDSNSIIENCTVQACSISGNHYVTGIVGYVAENCSITFCQVNNSIISGTWIRVAGIAGLLSDSCTITNCIVKNSTINGPQYVSGIAGYAVNSTITNCIFNGTLSGFQESGSSVGGISGYLEATTIENCIVFGTVRGTSTEYASTVGGVAGWVDSGNIQNCLVLSNVSSSDNAGGIIGYADSTTFVENCVVLAQAIDSENDDSPYGISGSGTLENNYVWNGTLSSGSFFNANIGINAVNGGTVSSEEFWNNQSFFEDTLGWDFEKTWKMNTGNENYQLPVLQIMKTPVDGDVSYLLKIPSIPSLKDTYIVGIDANYPPFTYIDSDGTPTGFDVELILWIAELQGFNVIIQPVAWEAIIPVLNAGQIDMILSMSITPDRAEQVTFSDTCYSDSYYGDLGIAMRKDDTGLHAVINEGLAELKASDKWDELVAKYFGGSTPEPTPVEEIIVRSAADLADTLNAEVSDNVVTLTQDVTIENPIRIYLNAGEEIILTTAGDYSLYRGVADNYLITVQRGTLTLKGKDSTNQLTIDGRKDIYTENTDGLIYVRSGGCLNLSDNAILTNNAADSGAGVNVGTNGHFEMHGGEISNNYARYAGAGVDVSGEFADYDSEGQVTNVKYGYFNMSGGRICNNEGTGLFNYGITTISGGEISNNTDGISSGGGELIMTGGTIRSNTYDGVTLFDGRIGTYVDGDIVYRDTTGKLFISGDMAIPSSECVWIGDNSTIIVTGPLSANAGIYNIQTSKESGVIVNATDAKIPGEDLLSHFVLNEDGYSLTANGYTLVLSPASTDPTHTLNLQLSTTSVNKGDMLRISGETTLPAGTNLTLGLVAGNIQDEDAEVVDAFFLYVQEGDAEMNTWSTAYDTSALEPGEYFFIIFSTDNTDIVSNTASFIVSEVTVPTPTPEKPEAPTLTPPESLPEDAEETTNTVAETSAATKAEVGYQVSPTDIAEMKAPTITRGSLSVMLNDKVKVTKKLADGTEEEVEAEVLEDGTVKITGSLDGAASVTVNFIGRQFGDVTNDGKPDTLDAARVLQASVGLYEFSGADTFYGDVSGDGFANTLDAARILQYSVNLVDENYVTKA